jgi:SAM-dependent methyltransferase
MDSYKPENYGDAIADVYDFAIPHDEDTDKSTTFLTSFGKTGKVLELGAGTGRLAIPLAQAGLDVSAVEISSKMIEQLRLKPGGDLVNAIQADMVDLPAGQYSLIYLVAGSLCSLITQDSQVRCLQSVRSHLAPGGRFVLESYVAGIDGTAVDNSVWPALMDTNMLAITARKFDRMTQVANIQTVLLTAEGTRLFPAQIRFYSPAELDLMARIAGLRLVNVYGDWEGAPFTSDSRRYISVYAAGDARS